MSRSVLILATHIINEGIISEYRKMKNTPNVDAVLMIDNNKKTYDAKERIETRTFFNTEAKCFFFDLVVHDELKLPYYPAKREKFGTIMWYNADYRFYYFRHYFPDYDYYWLIEYDVFFNAKDRNYSAFLERYDGSDADFVGPKLKQKKLNSDWSASHKAEWIYKDHVYGTVFPVIRLSGKAIDFLYKKRLDHVSVYEKAEGTKRWIFVEAFVPTELKNNGFTFSETREPHVLPEPAISLNEKRIFETPDDFLYHPVKPVGADLMDEISKFNTFKKEFILEQAEFVSQSIDASMHAFALAIRSSSWLTNQSISLSDQNPQDVGWKYLLALYRLLDEYHPKSILELNLGHPTRLTAQYAAKFQAAHSIIEHDRDRVEHYMHCWNIPWSGTSIYGSPLSKTTHAAHCNVTGVCYQNFPQITKGKRYNLILQKCPAFGKEALSHLDLLLALPGILADDFAILLDHTEDPCGNMVLHDIESLLEKHEIKFIRKDFVEPGRKCCILASESWKYIMEF